MRVQVVSTTEELGRRAAEDGAAQIRHAIAQHGEASLVLATGTSQLKMLATLVRAEDVDWSRVTAFHLDEYVGMPITHPASFRRYLKERFVECLPTPVRAFHYIDGENDGQAECRRLGRLIEGHSIDVAFIGIGENGHLAFNDPPADFETEEPYLVVQLDEACRRQQLGEGWFPTLDDVPRQAISMSVRQILKAQKIVCTVPDRRKADAVQRAVEGPVTNQTPASVLQTHANTTLWLDQPAAALLKSTG